LTAHQAPLDKTISIFQPLDASTPHEVDRHYRQVHTRFARNFLREMPQVMSYHISRAEAEFDLNGRWNQRPRAFRFIVMRFQPGRSLEAPDALRRAIVQDHRTFLRELRAFHVLEETVVDRLAGQTALQKYVFEFERPAEVSAEQAAAHIVQALGVLREQAGAAFGLRQVLVNHVLSEGEVAAVDEPDQRPTGQLLPSTTRQAFLECYFDQQEWAEDWFARPEVRAIVTDPFWALARGSRVDEQCGLDRR